MQAAIVGTRPSKFVVPEGMSLIPVNRKTGMAAADGDPDTIIEAFKPAPARPRLSRSSARRSIYPAGRNPEGIAQANDAINRGSSGLF